MKRLGFAGFLFSLTITSAQAADIQGLWKQSVSNGIYADWVIEVNERFISGSLYWHLADRVDANRVKRTDLWAGIQFPDGTIFLRTSRNIVNSFITYNPPHENGQAFIPNVERMNDDFPMLDLILPLGLSGKFIFYAVHVDLGKNPFVDAWRSNLAIKEITLE